MARNPIKLLEVSEDLCGKFNVMTANQNNPTTQLLVDSIQGDYVLLERIRTSTETVAISDQALNCSCPSNGRALNCIIGVTLVYLARHSQDF